jgi:hypothetical protein
VQGDDAPGRAARRRLRAHRGRARRIPLTYFEFGTLAALAIFADADLDLAILEVGLGGRLDAVNIVDADVAVLTTVDLDHQEYLGNDRETIGADKAGIFRAGRPCVLGERDPPSSVLRHAYADRRLRDPRPLRLPGRTARRRLELARARLSRSICRCRRWWRRRSSTTPPRRSPRCARCRSSCRTRAIVEGVRAAHVPGACR